MKKTEINANDIRFAMRTRRSAGVRFLVTIGVLAAAVLCGLSADAAQRKVRFSFRSEPDFAENDGAGRRYGHYVEWVNRIASVLDWDVEWVECPWGETQSMLAQGKVDVVGPVGNMPENAGKLRITQIPIGRYRMTLRALEDSPLDPDRLSELDGRTVGVPKNHPINAELRRQLAAIPVSCKLRGYVSSESLVSALVRHEVDAVFCPSYDRLPPTKALLPSVLKMTYLGVAPDADGLAAQLDSAMSSITEANPLFAGEVWRMWRPDSDRVHPVEFTVAERRWLAKTAGEDRMVRLDVSSGAGMNAVEFDHNRVGGPLSVVLKTLSDYTDVRYEVRCQASAKDASGRLCRGESDVWFPTGDAGASRAIAERYGFRRHDVRVPQAVCMMRDQKRHFMDKRLRIGVLMTDKDRLAAYRRFGLTSRLTLFASPEGMVNGLLAGTIDEFVGDFAHTRRLVRKMNVGKRVSVRYAWMLRYRSRYSFFVSPKAEPELSTVLGRLLASFSQDDFVDFALRSESGENRFLAAFWTLFPHMAAVVILTAMVVIALLFASRRRIRRALRDSMAATRAKTRFLATVSHELRTPLNAIVGFSEVLSSTETPASQVKESADGITQASRALLSLVNNVLDVAKLENDGCEGSDFRRGSCDLALLSGEMRSIFSAAAKKKGLTLDFNCPPAGLCLELNPARLRQVMLNLIGNALKFTSVGSVKVDVAYADGRFSLTVSDTGVGISAAVQQTIFNPFVQDLSRQNQIHEHGTGLGLAIVKRLVENGGGSVSLRSEEGKGTVVCIRVTDVRECALPPTVVPPDAAAGRDFSRLTVMLVDDTPVNVRVLELMLRKAGVGAVHAFPSAADALQVLRHGLRADLILSDVWMPKMSGPEFARIVAAEWPAIPVVAVTADVDASDSFDVKVFRAIVSKPVTLQKLESLLASLQTAALP